MIEEIKWKKLKQKKQKNTIKTSTARFRVYVEASSGDGCCHVLNLNTDINTKNERLQQKQVRLDSRYYCKYLRSVSWCSVMLDEIKWIKLEQNKEKNMIKTSAARFRVYVEASSGDGCCHVLNMNTNINAKNERLQQKQVRLDSRSYCKYLWSVSWCSVMLYEFKLISASRENRRMGRKQVSLDSKQGLRRVSAMNIVMFLIWTYTSVGKTNKYDKNKCVSISGLVANIWDHYWHFK